MIDKTFLCTQILCMYVCVVCVYNTINYIAFYKTNKKDRIINPTFSLSFYDYILASYKNIVIKLDCIHLQLHICNNKLTYIKTLTHLMP